MADPSPLDEFPELKRVNPPTKHIDRSISSPGGGNPPLNSNVITGKRAVKCCEKAGLLALKAGYQYLDNHAIPAIAQARDGPSVVDFSGGEAAYLAGFIKNPVGPQLPDQLRPLPDVMPEDFPKLPGTKVPLPKTFPSTAEKVGVGAVILGFAFTFVIELWELNQWIAAMTETSTALKKIEESFGTEKGLTSCEECVKEHLLWQEKHKKITLEEDENQLGF